MPNVCNTTEKKITQRLTFIHQDIIFLNSLSFLIPSNSISNLAFSLNEKSNLITSDKICIPSRILPDFIR